MKKIYLLSTILALGLSTRSYAVTENNPIPTTADTVQAVQQSSNDNDSKSLLKGILDKLPKISGYVQTGYQYNSIGNHTSSFQAKRLRLIADGNVAKNVSFRLQIEAFNGISGTTNGRGQKNLAVMDAFITARFNNAFKIRVGQYYLPLGYENYDISPATLETVDFSDICYRMVCRNPVAYDFIEYGRDLGVMVFGDFLPSANKEYNHFSYTASLTNGSLPNKDDNNKSKDLIASLTYRPIKNLSIKGSFNWGQYTGTVNTINYKNQDMYRVIVGAWYKDPIGLNIRVEYGHQQGKNQGNSIILENGFYALASYHVGHFEPVVRYSLYRDNINRNTLSNYNALLIGTTYTITKNIKLQLNYIHTMYTDDAKIANNGKSASDKLQLMGLFRF